MRRNVSTPTCSRRRFVGVLARLRSSPRWSAWLATLRRRRSSETRRRCIVAISKAWSVHISSVCTVLSLIRRSVCVFPWLASERWRFVGWLLAARVWRLVNTLCLCSALLGIQFLLSFCVLFFLLLTESLRLSSPTGVSFDALTFSNLCCFLILSAMFLFSLALKLINLGLNLFTTLFPKELGLGQSLVILLEFLLVGLTTSLQNARPEFVLLRENVLEKLVLSLDKVQLLLLTSLNLFDAAFVGLFCSGLITHMSRIEEWSLGFSECSLQVVHVSHCLRHALLLLELLLFDLFLFLLNEIVNLFSGNFSNNFSGAGQLRVEEFHLLLLLGLYLLTFPLTSCSLGIFFLDASFLLGLSVFSLLELLLNNDILHFGVLTLELGHLTVVFKVSLVFCADVVQFSACCLDELEVSFTVLFGCICSDDLANVFHTRIERLKLASECIGFESIQSLSKENDIGLVIERHMDLICCCQRNESVLEFSARKESRTVC
mmetsp:Transcript_4729/g.17749  ORF Transcript_4729/g.17749 Transcript_4729/m.17749 type:complete len:490 (-) Transcript_4729:1378-2847(-)